MIALASLTGSFITLLGILGGVVAFVSLLRDPPEALPKEGVWLSLTFASYFAVLAITTTLNGPDPERFIEFVIISPFIYFIPLALILPVRCTDISLKGLGRAAMIGTVPTAILALVYGTLMTGLRPTLAAGNSNVLSALLLLQTFLCLSGWLDVNKWERRMALACFTLGFVGLVLGVGSRGANLSAGFLAFLCILLWSYTQTRKIQAITLVSLVTVILLAAVLVTPISQDRVQTLSMVAEPGFGDWSSSDLIRLTMYRGAVRAIMENPWIGMGLHLRFDGVRDFLTVQPPDNEYYRFTHVHNLFLTHGTAAGVLGILAALSLFTSVLYLAIRRAQSSAMVRWLGTICAFSLFFLGLTETVLFHDLNTTFYMFSFVLVAIFAHQARVQTISK